MHVPLSGVDFQQIFNLNYGKPRYDQSNIWYAGGGKFFKQEHGQVGVECLWSTPKPQNVATVPSESVDTARNEASTSVIIHTSKLPKTEPESPMSSPKKVSAHMKKTMETVSKEIEEICKKGQLSPEILDQAKSFYLTICGPHKLGGKRSEAMPAACVYIACREAGVPRSFSEVSEISGQKRNHLAHCFNVARNRMETKPKKVTATDYIIRIGATLNLPEPVRMAAVTIASKATELNLVAGRSPVTVAVGATFMATKIHKSKVSPCDVSDVGGVSVLAMKTVYQLLLINIHNLLPIGFLAHVSLDSLSEF